MNAAVRERNPLFMPAVIFLAALSLSIGWGIRGNFGHESGAMIPGALTAIVIAAFSRREDWQSRIPHAALWGGLGYGFGGSISYMYPISYTMSGQFDTMVYGFLTTFLEGGLWCSMGVAGAALALTAPRDRLAQLYAPLLFVLGAMFIKQFGEDWLDYVLSPERDLGSDTWHRQKAPLYWFDADWFAAVTALVGVCAYDLWSRAPERARWPSPLVAFFGALGGEGAYLAWHRLTSHELDLDLASWILVGALLGLLVHNLLKRHFSHVWLVLLFMSVGAGLGWLVQLGLDKSGALKPLLDAIVIPQGDLRYINPATGHPFPVSDLMTNWPQFFGDYPQHVGWLIGAVVGFLTYFAIWGEWKNDSSLFASMALGWLIAFMVMPVFGSIFLMQYGGFRMTPPRSDDWAGIVGVFIATLMWAWRRNYHLVTLAGTLGFLFGGFGFTTAHLLRTMARIPGHPLRTPGEQSEFLEHYQGANWHSIMEQSQGFWLGLATVFALAFIWRRDPARTSGARMPSWTTTFAVLFTLFGFTFMNLYKVIDTWTLGDNPTMPEWMKAPLLDFINLPAIAWFNLAWWAAALAAFALCLRNRRHPLAFLPASDAGRGQLLWLAVVWLMVLGNFSRALPGFSEGRLVTEWVIFINACIATALIGVPSVASYVSFSARRNDVVESLAGRDYTFGTDDPTPLVAVGVPVAELEVSPTAVKPRWGLLKLAAIWIIGLAIAFPAMYGYAQAVQSAYHGSPVEDPKYSHRRFGPDAIWRTNPILKHGEHR